MFFANGRYHSGYFQPRVGFGLLAASQKIREIQAGRRRNFRIRSIGRRALRFKIFRRQFNSRRGGFSHARSAQLSNAVNFMYCHSLQTASCRPANPHHVKHRGRAQEFLARTFLLHPGG